MKTFNVILSVALAVLLCDVAESRPLQPKSVERVVRYADLNLNSSEGIARLHARIRAAARGVCGSAETRNQLLGAQMRAARACVAAAVERAVAAVNAPALTRLASTRGQLR